MTLLTFELYTLALLDFTTKMIAGVFEGTMPSPQGQRQDLRNGHSHVLQSHGIRLVLQVRTDVSNTVDDNSSGGDGIGGILGGVGRVL